MAREVYSSEEKIKKFESSILKNSLKYIKPHLKEIIAIFLLGIFYSIFIFLMPKFLGNAIDSFDNISFPYIFTQCAYAFLCLSIALIFLYFRNKLSIKLNIKVSIELRNDLIDKLTKLPISYFENTPHGKIYNRLVNYVDSITSFLCDTLMNFVLQMITFIVLFVFMLTINVPLTFLNFLLFLLVTGFYILITPKWMKLKKASINKDASIVAFITETSKGVFVTQSNNREKKNINTLKSLAEERWKLKNKLRYLNNTTWTMPHLFESISTIAIYVLGLAFFYPAFSIGSIIIYVSYSNQLWHPISQFVGLYDTSLTAISYLERVYELLLHEEEKNSGKSDMIEKGTIEFQNVSFGYGEKEVLHNLSFRIPDASKVAIVGSTGSGKSTLIGLITKLYDIDSGSILVDGKNIKDISLNSLRHNVMIMSQDSYLFQDTIYNNLKLGNPSASLETVREVCQFLEIDGLIRSLKDGYETIITNNGSNFSIGQKQMLSIARMMIANPKIVILDEATSNIDLITEQKVIASFFKAFEGKTSIVIAHRLATVINSDMILVMNDGNLVEMGSHRELLKKKGYYYKLYKAQTI